MIRGRWQPASLVAAVLVSVVGAAGCSGERDALNKRVLALQEEVTLLQNSQDRLEERLAAIELRQSQMAEGPAQTAPSAPRTMERPRLKVIRVEPDSAHAPPTQGSPTPRAPQPEDSESDTPRPVIRGTGTRLQSSTPPGPTSYLDPMRSTLPLRQAASASEPCRPLGA